MHEVDFMWAELHSMDGFYSHTPGETPLIALGTHIIEGSADYWRVFLGLLGVHYSLTDAQRVFPQMAFSTKKRKTQPAYAQLFM